MFLDQVMYCWLYLNFVRVGKLCESVCIPGVEWILVHRHFTCKSGDPRTLTPLIILEQSLKYKSCRVLKMVSSFYFFFNIFRKYTIMEKRIEEFVKIAIAVKCNRGEHPTRCVLSKNEFYCCRESWQLLFY
jgi:hypothetical protein